MSFLQALPPTKDDQPSYLVPATGDPVRKQLTLPSGPAPEAVPAYHQTTGPVSC